MTLPRRVIWHAHIYVQKQHFLTEPQLVSRMADHMSSANILNKTEYNETA